MLLFEVPVSTAASALTLDPPLTPPADDVGAAAYLPLVALAFTGSLNFGAAEMPMDYKQTV